MSSRYINQWYDRNYDIADATSPLSREHPQAGFVLLAFERAFEQFLTDPENGIFKGPWAQLKLPFRLAVEGEVIPFEFSPGFLPFKH